MTRHQPETPGISKEFSKYCNENNITRKYGTANLHTGTGLAERTIQSLKNLLNANLEDGTNLRNSLEKALNVLRFTTHSELEKNTIRTPFWTKTQNEINQLKKRYFSRLERLVRVHNPKLYGWNHRPLGDVQEEDDRSEVQTGDDFLSDKEPAKYGQYEHISFLFLRKELQNEFIGQ